MAVESGSLKVQEAILRRQSIRAFKPDPVPRDVLSNIIEIASRSPSADNSQPWEFAIVHGTKLREITDACVERFRSARPDSDFGFFEQMPEPYAGRGKTLGKSLYETLGIRREDMQGRFEYLLHGLRLFNAPAAIYVCIDRSMFSRDGKINVYPVFDCGLVSQNISLLATQFGLGTVMQGMGVFFPGIVREKLGLPDNKLMLVSIAIGYPDENDIVNSFRSERVPIDDVAKWYGW